MEFCTLGSRWFPAFEEICMLNELCFVLQGSIATCIFMTFLSGIFLGSFPKCYEKVICFQKGIACLKIINVIANVEIKYVRGDVENTGAD